MLLFHLKGNELIGGSTTSGHPATSGTTIPLLVLIAFGGYTIFAFNQQNLIVPFVWTATGFFLVHLGSLVINWVRQLYSKQQLRSVFASYIAPTVMDQLLESPDNIKLGGVRKPVTILFSDVRSFTTISESMNEETLVAQLNEYFEEMVGAVNQYEGTLHKYIGDAVNLASRLEGVTKQYRTDLIVGESVRELLGPGFLCRSVGSLIVKGRSTPVTTYEVLGEIGRDTGDWDPNWVVDFEQGYQCFLKQEFPEATGYFESFLKHRPEDFIARGYIDACQELTKNPPGENWDGVVVLKDK